MALSDIDNLEPSPTLGDYGHHFYHILIHNGASSLKSLVADTNSTVMKNAGGQSLSGIKTFSS